MIQSPVSHFEAWVQFQAICVGFVADKVAAGQVFL